MRIFPLHQKDGYKIDHRSQYPKGTNRIVTNMTPRQSRLGLKGIVTFGMQYFLIEYFQRQWTEEFFDKPLDQVLKRYKRRIDTYLGPDAITFDHIAELHALKYLPLRIRSIDEGRFVPLRVPTFTIENTRPEAFWLPNAMETLMSASLWKLSTTATTAALYRRTFEDFAKATGASRDFIPWQGHDFSMRGHSTIEDAAIQGMAHLIYFTGTDTFAAIDLIEDYYHASSDLELIGGSVPATEHSVMCMGMQEHEFDTFDRIIFEIYPKGIVSVVSDTWDFWQILTKYAASRKDRIMQRDGKVVFRPDSGDPVKILAGDPNASVEHVRKGAVEVLWDIFGGTVTGKGFKTLDPHVGLIYGDSITHDRQVRILSNLAAKQFASDNQVLGIGSFTYQYVTRDTHGFAMKATYGEVDGKPQAIFKKPATDDGTKNSARGQLAVINQPLEGMVLVEDASQDVVDSKANLLKTRFLDGKLLDTTTFTHVRSLGIVAMERL